MNMDLTRTQELIQADLDGELSAAERAELARRLLADPEARRLRDELKRTDTLLREVPQVAPPAGLRPAILAALGLPATESSSGTAGRDRWPVLRLAAAVVGGLLVVGIGYRMLDVGPTGSDLQGSLGAALPSQATQAIARPDQARFSGDGVEASATLRRDGQGTKLALELGGTAPYEVIARFDPEVTTYRGNPDESGLSFTDGTVTLQVEPGQPSRTLEFSGTAPIRVSIRSGEKLLGEQELSVGADN